MWIKFKSFIILYKSCHSGVKYSDYKFSRELLYIQLVAGLLALGWFGGAVWTITHFKYELQVYMYKILLGVMGTFWYMEITRRGYYLRKQKKSDTQTVDNQIRK